MLKASRRRRSKVARFISNFMAIMVAVVAPTHGGVGDQVAASESKVSLYAFIAWIVSSDADIAFQAVEIRYRHVSGLVSKRLVESSVARQRYAFCSISLTECSDAAAMVQVNYHPSSQLPPILLARPPKLRGMQIRILTESSLQRWLRGLMSGSSGDPEKLFDGASELPSP
jgi:hypothetical protein